jgi:hypothetical protein
MKLLMLLLYWLCCCCLQTTRQIPVALCLIELRVKRLVEATSGFSRLDPTPVM